MGQWGRRGQTLKQELWFEVENATMNN